MHSSAKSLLGRQELALTVPVDKNDWSCGGVVDICRVNTVHSSTKSLLGQQEWALTNGGKHRFLHEPKGHKGSRFREAELKGISTACTATTNNSPYVPDAPRTSTEVKSPYQLILWIQVNWIYWAMVQIWLTTTHGRKSWLKDMGARWKIPMMEGTLWWKTTLDGRRPYM